MQGKEVLVIRTGIANLASVFAGLTRMGAKPFISENPDEILRAESVMLPGVGSFAAGMQQLRNKGIAEPLKKRILDGKPTLAICLGLQLLCKKSEESPGVPGLGIIDQTVLRFPDSVRVPQLGWNRIEPEAGCRLLQMGYAYFANSFRLLEPPQDWRIAYSEYGGRFVSALEQGSVLACQFHPELSGEWGLDLMKRWLSQAPLNGGEAC